MRLIPFLFVILEMLHLRNSLPVIIFVFFSTIAYATKANDFSVRIKQDFFLEKARDHSLPPAERLTYYDTIIKHNPSPRLCMEKGIVLEELGDYPSANKTYSRIKSELSPDSISLYSNILWRLAASDYFNGDATKVIQTADEALSIKKPDSLAYIDVEINRILAHLFSDINDSTRQELYYERALQSFERLKNSDCDNWLKELTDGKMHYTRCCLSLLKKDYQSAFSEIKKAQTLLDKYWPKAFTAINNGIIYQALGESGMAADFYKEIISTPDVHPNHTLAILNYCCLLLEEGKNDEAYSLLHSNIDNLRQLQASPWEVTFHTIRSQVEEAAGNPEVALEALKAASQLSDSIYSEQLMLALGHLTEFYDNVAPGDRHKQESGPASPVILWIALGAMAAFSAFAAWRWIKQKERSEEMLERLKALESGSNESKRADEENCNKRGSELSVLSMHLASLSKELNTIEKDAGDKNLSRSELAERINKSLKIHKTQENAWGMFKVYFQEANQGFFDKLYKACPELTNAEVRMCAFILAGMTTKEIAIATNRSVRTVDCIKYNLRCKLNISEPTESFIRRLSSSN